MKKCPSCRVIHWDGVARCDCGYSFEARTTLADPHRVRQNDASEERQWKRLIRTVAMIMLFLLVIFIGKLVGRIGIDYANRPSIENDANPSIESALNYAARHINATLPRTIDK